MSSLSVILRTAPIAVSGWLSSANASALGSIAERRDAPANQIYTQSLKDEGLEHLLQFAGASLATQLLPNLPQQASTVLGKLAGSTCHWTITSPGSLNRKRSRENGNGQANREKTFAEKFHEKIIEGPSSLILELAGIGGENPDYLRYFLTQAVTFGIATYGLTRIEEENLPGLNLERDSTITQNVLKGISYFLGEQFTYLASQTIRCFLDFREDLGENAVAKALGNVINEKFIPGHILSAACGSLSTVLLSNFIPRTTAACVGEMPMKFLNRIMNAHRRRATKTVTKDGQEIPNYRVGKGFIETSDKLSNGIRNQLLKLVTYLFNIKMEDLTSSFNLREENEPAIYQI